MIFIDELVPEEPMLSEEQLFNNERILKESLQKNIRIRYWSNGFEVSLEGKLESIDENPKLIIVNKNDELIYIIEI